MKRILLSLLALVGLSLTTATAQAQSRGFSIEVGTLNALRYEMGLGKHFGVQAVAGIVPLFDRVNSNLSYTGLAPLAEVNTRWYFSRQERDASRPRGGYFGFRLGWEGGDDFTFLPGVKELQLLRYRYTYYLAPTFGWHIGVTERSALRLAVGLGFVKRQRVDLLGGHFWEGNYGSYPLLLEATWGIRL